MRLQLPLLLPSALLLVACEGPRDRDITPAPQPVTIQNTSSLRTTFGADDVNVVGITVDPNDGRRYVLDANRGIFELTEGGVREVALLEQLVIWDRLPASAFTDVAALGDGRFALTAANDGFLLETDSMMLSQYFCYVPGEIVGEFEPTPITQLTRSVTYDPVTDRMYAQPQTFANDITGEVVRSSIGQFSLDGGEGFGWMELPDLHFLAGGIAMQKDGTMLLGNGAKLHTFSMEKASLDEDAIDLTRYGITAIEAMAYDRNTDTLLVVDALTDELVELTLN